MLKSFLISFTISLFLILFGASIREQSIKKAQFDEDNNAFYECLGTGETEETCKHG